MSNEVHTVPVHVQIPVDQFKVLAVAARTHGTTVAALVTELTRRGLQPGGTKSQSPRSPATPRKVYGRGTPEKLNELVRMWEAGATDVEIAARVEMSTAWVGAKRKRLGLAGHPHGGRPVGSKTRESVLIRAAENKQKGKQ